MDIALLGYGLIGKKRLEALRRLRQEGTPIDRIGVYDPYVETPADLIQLKTMHGVSQFDPDWVIIATPHNVSADLVKKVIPWGCNVLMEKPMGRSLAEAESIYDLLQNDEQLHIGMNYRFYEGVAQLIRDMEVYGVGDLVNINMELGYGGKPQDKDAWSLSPEGCGPSALHNPGIHLLDLLRFFEISKIKPLYGKAWRGFWKTGIDEEVTLMLEDFGCIITLKVSLVNWVNTFKIEVNSKNGYFKVNGRGGNYGQQTYVRGERWGWMSGKSQRDSEELVVVSDCSDSFYSELDALLGNRSDYLLPPCSALSAMKTMELYEECVKVIK